MLNLWLFNPSNINYIHSAGIIFDAEFEEEWIEEDITREIIKDVDKSEVVSGSLIQSPILGAIPPTYLSCGTKTLIMAAHDNSRIYNLTSCGNNCAKWILKLASNKDITMRLGNYMDFSEIDNFKVKVLNNDEIVTDYQRLVRLLVMYQKIESDNVC